MLDFVFRWFLERSRVNMISELYSSKLILTLKMVFSSSDGGMWRVACFQGIWKRRWSGLIHCKPGNLPLFTWTNNQGFRRILRGWKLMVKTLGTLGGRLEVQRLNGRWSHSVHKLAIELSLISGWLQIDHRSFNLKAAWLHSELTSIRIFMCSLRKSDSEVLASLNDTLGSTKLNWLHTSID